MGAHAASVCFLAMAIGAIASCSASEVAPYASCSPGDTCSPGTACESELVDDDTTEDGTTPAAAPPTFCTHSCSTDDDCPKDPDGNHVVCAVLDSSPASTSFCFRTCTSSCPQGQVCAVLASETTQQTICAPTLPYPDPLGSTAWQTTTVPSGLQSTCNVTMSSFTMTFGPSSAPIGTPVTGTFDATLVLTFGSAGAGAGEAQCDFAPDGLAAALAGCTETDVITSETYVDSATSATTGTVGIGPSNGDATTITTSRAGCADPDYDMTAASSGGVFDQGFNVQGSFVIDGNTMTGEIGPFAGSYDYTKTGP